MWSLSRKHLTVATTSCEGLGVSYFIPVEGRSVGLYCRTSTAGIVLVLV